MANNELLDTVMDYIESHRDVWNQNVWRSPAEVEKVDQEGRSYLPVDCHTSFCFAGWACELGPEKALWYSEELLHADEFDLADHVDYVRSQDGVQTINPAYRAQRLLGLDEEQAEMLFSGNLSMKDLKHFLLQIKAGLTGDEMNWRHPSNRQDEED